MFGIVPATPRAGTNSRWTMNIDYGQDEKSLIRRAKFNWREPGLSEEMWRCWRDDFESPKLGLIRTEIHSFEFDGVVGSGDVFGMYRSLRLRPMTLKELVTVAIEESNRQTFRPLISLGSSALVGSTRIYPYLTGKGFLRTLQYAYAWTESTGFQFLGIDTAK